MTKYKTSDRCTNRILKTYCITLFHILMHCPTFNKIGLHRIRGEGLSDQIQGGVIDAPIALKHFVLHCLTFYCIALHLTRLDCIE